MPPNELTDISEKGRTETGEPCSLNRRLFLQLLTYTDSTDDQGLIDALKQTDFHAVLYKDVNDPYGVALLTAHESPDFFVSDLRNVLNHSPFCSLTFKPDYTMLGRTYSVGYESDLEHVLMARPLQRICNPDWPWAIWYPLRRSGNFQKLSLEEQTEILMEHGTIGNAFGQAGHAYDIRLACHGLDKNDNDFIIGLVGKELYPLSSIVQTMRKTRQTSEFLTNLGPFFVGKTMWQSQKIEHGGS
ncbi:MAG: hypothetical protein GKR87_11610 [Kiritimatiellae bacterium]|nr:hypothetical protein [Kiritimatiellia bacterium]